MVKTPLLAPGALLQERYLVERLIAKSLMGAVYEAIDQRFGSTIALKQVVVWDEDLRDELQKAFTREARLLNKLRHPALPVVHDYFTEDGGQFLVMQFIPGETLGDIVARGNNPVKYEEVLQWADRILDALEYLHGQNPPIIHRDIKPANLKLTERGEIFLLDFGLAKETLNLSVYGYTREYASYEQIQGLGTDPRSDLYSLAATLFRFMTGTLPPDALARAGDVMRGLPDPLQPVHEMNPLIPVAVSHVLHRAMNQNPDERPQSASAMRSALASARSRVAEGDEETVVTKGERSGLIRELVPFSLASSSLSKHPPNVAEEELDGRGVGTQLEEETTFIESSKRWRSILRSPLLYWASIFTLTVLIVFIGVFIYRIRSTIAAYKAFTEGSQLMEKGTDDARQRALMKYQEALALSRTGRSKTGEADSLYNIGRVHYAMGDKKRSLDFYGQALTIYKATNDHIGAKVTLRSMGTIYSELGERSKSQQLYKMAEEAK